MTWERIEAKHGTIAFARISIKGKNKVVHLNTGATELLKASKWAIFYVDSKNKLFAIEPLSEFEPGAVKRVSLNKGKSSMFINQEFVDRMVNLEKCQEEKRFFADTSLTDNKQLVFKY